MMRFFLPVVSFSCAFFALATSLAMAPGTMMLGGRVTATGGGGGSSTACPNAVGQTAYSASAPIEAANAGFSCYAANFDFSDPSYATQSNWLDCGGSGGGVTTGLAWHRMSSNNPAATVYPCNVNQVVDPIYSNTVIAVQFLQSYNGIASGNAFVTIGTRTNNKSTFLDFGNAYFEGTMRQDVNVNNGGPNGYWSWSSNDDVNHSGGGPIELDFVETYGNNGYPFGDGQAINWSVSQNVTLWQSNTSANVNVPSGWSANAFHKYGILFTSDGATSQWACGYIDDVFQSCINSSNSSLDFRDRHYLMLWAGTSNQPVGGTQNLYVENVRIWSCANWNNGSQGSPPYTNPTAAAQCNGSTLYNSGGLTYWH